MADSKRALISVYDKTGLDKFARGLSERGFKIISTGGTLKFLKEAGINGLIPIEDITGFPEMLGGRVKTLHPRIHAGILAARNDSGHMQTIAEHGIETIDIVVCNLYPFKETILKENVTLEEVIENIDIGGPSMLRAAAKNYRGVAAVTDPSDYGMILKELEESGGISDETRFMLCAKVFEHTAHYDALIAAYMKEKASRPMFSDTITFTYERVQEMSYGENPHQKAAFYKEIGSGKGTIAGFTKLHGKDLSFNNINDANGALALLNEFDEPTAVASKHTNPCGVGTGVSISEAFSKAYESDPVSVFGGIVALNREVDEATAHIMRGIVLDIIIAPSFSPEALSVLTGKKNTRLLTLPEISSKVPSGALDYKRVSGGIIVQSYDNALFPDNADITSLAVATKRKPTPEEYRDLLFAWKIVKHVKSNAIAIAKNGQSVGIGCGQVNRIWPTKQAIGHGSEALGKDALIGAALASDAFFPFDDCVTAAAAAGITSIIQPGGSLRDKDSIEACDKFGIAMIITGMRHFKH